MSVVAIIDYGLCNLDSIKRAIEICGGQPVVTSDAADFDRASHLILPGVGAFGVAMENLRKHALDRAIVQKVEAGLPLLGICLGMQLLASRSEEGGNYQGLALIPGDVTELRATESGERVPHVGWNTVELEAEHLLFADIGPAADFYFVHSYHFACRQASDVIARTPYCGGFISAIQRGRIFGTQFHPEKSQRVGFRLLANFLAL